MVVVVFLFFFSLLRLLLLFLLFVCLFVVVAVVVAVAVAVAVVVVAIAVAVAVVVVRSKDFLVASLIGNGSNYQQRKSFALRVLGHFAQERISNRNILISHSNSN